MTGPAPATIVPVALGCCPDPPRCLLCGPPPPEPGPDLLRALVHHYRQERAPPGGALRVGFYGGAPPSDALLDGLDGLPFVARVRPDLLTRAALDRLIAAGAVAVELDALTFSDPALKAAGRRYGARLIEQQLQGLRDRGLRAGLVLTPGLPGTDHAQAVEDARRAADRADFVRIHPVLVLDGSALRLAHLDGRYVPLGLGEAITTCRAMLDLLEPAGVEVIRIGLNPRADGYGRAVAGPRHPALRQLVEARRTLEALRAALAGTRPGARVAIRCHPADETQTRGPFNQHVRTLRAAFALTGLRVRPDPALPRGRIRVDEEGE